MAFCVINSLDTFLSLVLFIPSREGLQVPWNDLFGGRYNIALQISTLLSVGSKILAYDWMSRNVFLCVLPGDK